MRARRASALARFQAAAPPTDAEEVWRYSRIGELDLDAFAPLPADAAVEPGVPAELQPVLDAVGPRAGLLVLRNGRAAHAELDDAWARKGVTLGAAAEPDILGAVAHRSDFFVEMAAAFLADAAVVHVPDGVAVDAPIVVLNWIDADGAAVFPHTVVQAGDASQVTVLDHVASADVRALVVPTVELDARPAANLRYLNVQELGRRVWQLGYQASQVGKEATLVSSTVALGGDYARLRTDSKLVGDGATSHLLAVYFGDGGQMHDFRTLQDHAAPKTTSDLLFKGVVDDDAHSVYTGLIRVARGAAGTNAFQTNRNLVLGDGARADSVPNLEIEENDVRCSHASAVGPIDPEHRYYLEARGVPTEAAERLIVLGFLNEVVERTPVPGLRPALRAAVAAKLDKVGP